MKLTNCVFSGNSRDLVMEKGLWSSVEVKCQFSNCIFSGDFPSQDFASRDGGCVQRSRTASFEIWHFNTRLCPAITRSASQSIGFAASKICSVTGFQRSEILIGASGLSLSSNLRVSGDVWRTGAIVSTDDGASQSLKSGNLQSSEIFTVTSFPDPSDTALISGTLGSSELVSSESRAPTAVIRHSVATVRTGKVSRSDPLPRFGFLEFSSSSADGAAAVVGSSVGVIGGVSGGLLAVLSASVVTAVVYARKMRGDPSADSPSDLEVAAECTETIAVETVLPFMSQGGMSDGEKWSGAVKVDISVIDGGVE
jgi:hypothetical protein